MKKMKRVMSLFAVLSLSFALAACGNGNNGANNATGATDAPSNASSAEQSATPETSLSGSIEIDGSSTVYPITEAVAEEFGKENKDVRVTVGVSGTGGGFKRFAAGETAISNASRPIKDEEAELAKTNGVEYIELEVAYDGLSVLVNPENDWVDHLTTEELHEIFKPGSTVNQWSDVRSEWPAEEIKIFSPGADSGTFDYFTETINDEAQASRNDALVTFSEDDNTLVQGVEGEKYALGYFGFAYFEENQDKLKLVPIDGGKGPISPSAETINDGTYAPLSRPLYIYVNKAFLEKPEVKAFVDYYMNNAADLSEEVGYIRLPQEMYDEGIAKLQ
ncbi:phosphate ABC transporter substrate-binding protein [Paenibacillus sp. IHB B 3415]|uniref:PstS family phosphate ABC transporter substrate-binding protein n=1 Tax=Paenibacillus sp. IHB B 3415 TaxID=867080 RepID=UPI0005732377|nr:PstS family phosphate ABC transporter substrate-binding protein [Paenibacillus sp. IHB B 3415]KHL96776.1 phosphate ABC transporter substrate-binding protein [Paenibacillus sp. IHB B 3415]